MAIPRVEGTFTSSEGIPSNSTRHIGMSASDLKSELNMDMYLPTDLCFSEHLSRGWNLRHQGSISLKRGFVGCLACLDGAGT